MAASDVPDWVEGLKWIFAALILAFAFVGPQIMGPMMAKIKQATPNPASPPRVDNQMAVIGGALADKDAVYALASSIDKLTDVLEKRYKLEEEESEEAILQRRIKQAMKELAEKDKV